MESGLAYAGKGKAGVRDDEKPCGGQIMTLERKVKGSVLLDMVKVVRAFKDQPWDQHLKPGDWEIINSMVIPTEWYPIESYMRIGVAVYELVAKGNEDAVRQFGLAAMKDLIEGSYRPFLDKGDPFEATRKFLDLRKSLFNFSKMGMEPTGQRSLRVVISEFGQFEAGLDVFMILLKAHLEELIRTNGGKEISLEEKIEGDQDQVTMIVDAAWS